MRPAIPSPIVSHQRFRPRPRDCRIASPGRGCNQPQLRAGCRKTNSVWLCSCLSLLRLWKRLCCRFPFVRIRTSQNWPTKFSCSVFLASWCRRIYCNRNLAAEIIPSGRLSAERRASATQNQPRHEFLERCWCRHRSVRRRRVRCPRRIVRVAKVIFRRDDSDERVARRRRQTKRWCPVAVRLREIGVRCCAIRDSSRSSSGRPRRRPWSIERCPPALAKFPLRQIAVLPRSARNRVEHNDKPAPSRRPHDRPTPGNRGYRLVSNLSRRVQKLATAAWR